MGASSGGAGSGGGGSSAGESRTDNGTREDKENPAPNKSEPVKKTVKVRNPSGCNLAGRYAQGRARTARDGPEY